MSDVDRVLEIVRGLPLNWLNEWTTVWCLKFLRSSQASLFGRLPSSWVLFYNSLTLSLYQ